ncbi:MAG: metallophosphoesterase [Anaerolineales bacterium]
MSTRTKLTEVLDKVAEVPFDDGSRLILLGDLHRGTNNWADDSSQNQTLVFYALMHYYENGFTYIEVGDGDELLENRNFAEIKRAHSHIYWLMSKFHAEGRLYLLFGNHNMQWRNSDAARKELSEYYDEVAREPRPLFPDISVHEGLLLHHTETDRRLFVVHGHQGDLLSDTLWWLGRWIVRFVWTPLQLLGVRDITSPAQNFTKRNRVERRIVAWVAENEQPLIAGHTHRPVFPDDHAPPYYNVGSGVHPRCITGMEIDAGEIRLIKWSFKPDEEGTLRVTRETLEGPRNIGDI